MSDTNQKRRGFAGLACIKCGEADQVTLVLHDMSDGEALHCTACDTAYSLEEVRELLDGWRKVLAWVDQAPALD